MPIVSSTRCDWVPRVARRLVVVERHELLRKALVRYFGLSFETVNATENPDCVEELILAESQRPTDLLCRQSFGPQRPTASALLPRWRRILPSLGRVVITNATDEPTVECDEADAVCVVPIDARVLREILLGPLK